VNGVESSWLEPCKKGGTLPRKISRWKDLDDARFFEWVGRGRVAGAIAALLQLHLEGLDEWKDCWVDDLTSERMSSENDRAVVEGVICWGKLGTTAQWLDPLLACSSVMGAARSFGSTFPSPMPGGRACLAGAAGPSNGTPDEPGSIVSREPSRSFRRAGRRAACHGARPGGRISFAWP